jgi:hypothetical protein
MHSKELETPLIQVPLLLFFGIEQAQRDQLGANLAVHRIARAVGLVALGTDFMEIRSPTLKLTE